MKNLLIASILGLGLTSSAFARELTTYPQNTQTASDPDRSTAIENATEQATNWANSQCIGNVQDDATISTSAVNLGDSDNPNWTAVVTVRATCVLELQGR